MRKPNQICKKVELFSSPIATISRDSEIAPTVKPCEVYPDPVEELNDPKRKYIPLDIARIF